MKSVMRVALALAVFVPKASAAGAKTGMECDGTVLAFRSSYVNAQVIGNIREIYVEEGQHVETGSPLCRLDSTVEQANYEYTLHQSQDKTALEGALKADEQAVRDLKRIEDLGTVATQVEREQAGYYRDLAAIRVTAEQLKIERLEKLAALRKAEVDRYTVLAPFSGIVARKYAELGETTYPLDKRLIHLIDISKVYVEVHPDIELLREVSVGDEVSVIVELYPEKVFAGEVVFIAPSADLGGGGFALKVLVDNSEGLLKPEMKACVKKPSTDEAAATAAERGE